MAATEYELRASAMTDPSEPSGPDPSDDPPIEFDQTATMVFPRPKLEPREPTPEEASPIHVEVVGGPMDGLAERRDKTTFTIGRAMECDLPLPMDPMVSTQHAQITRSGGTHFLEDLGSRNGTVIGEQAIEGRVPLGPGATFVIGRTRIELLSR